MARPPPLLRIAVLAAGFSTRLGYPKALARVRGARLLDRTLHILAPFAHPSTIIVVVPPKSFRYRHPAITHATFVANRERAAGLSISVHYAIRTACYSSALLLLPVDLAVLERRDIARLVSRWRGARRAVVARRVADGAATPLILPRALFARALTVAGDRGLRDFVGRLSQERVILVSLPSAGLDVDTAQDLAIARRPKGWAAGQVVAQSRHETAG